MTLKEHVSQEATRKKGNEFLAKLYWRKSTKLVKGLRCSLHQNGPLTEHSNTKSQQPSQRPISSIVICQIVKGILQITQPSVVAVWNFPIALWVQTSAISVLHQSSLESGATHAPWDSKLM